MFRITSNNYSLTTVQLEDHFINFLNAKKHSEEIQLHLKHCAIEHLHQLDVPHNNFFSGAFSLNVN